MKAIGGYFEIELPEERKNFPINGVTLNSGRNALEYILRTLPRKPKKVYIPYYTCEVVMVPFKRLGITFEQYHIDRNFEISENIYLKEDEYILANNYFGIKDQYIASLAIKYGERLIVDNCQALYCPSEIAVHSFYSPRKFMGIPDGGIAVTQKHKELDLEEYFSWNISSHLIKRIDIGATEGYNDFKNNSHVLGSAPMQAMSKFSRRIYDSVDLDKIKLKRRNNFLQLASALDSTNRLVLPPADTYQCPMVYPYLTDDVSLRERLINEGIFVACYWPNVSNWVSSDSLENQYVTNLLALSIDQRYDADDMARIIAEIKK